MLSNLSSAEAPAGYAKNINKYKARRLLPCPAHFRFQRFVFFQRPYDTKWPPRRRQEEKVLSYRIEST